MHRDYFARQMQADAKAIVGHAFTDRQCRKFLEDPLEVIGGDANAVVTNANKQLTPFGLCFKPDPPAVRRELRGVIEQIGKHLPDAPAITFDHQRSFGQRHLDTLFPRLQCQCLGAADVSKQFGHIDRLTTQGHSTIGQTRDVEQVIDQPAHLPDLTLDDRQGALANLLRVRRMHQFERIADRCERVTQFMRQDRQKIILALIGLAQGNFGSAPPGDIEDRAGDALNPAVLIAKRLKRRFEMQRLTFNVENKGALPANAALENRPLESHQFLNLFGALADLIVAFADHVLEIALCRMQPGIAQLSIHGVENDLADVECNFETLRRQA